MTSLSAASGSGRTASRKVTAERRRFCAVARGLRELRARRARSRQPPRHATAYAKPRTIEIPTKIRPEVGIGATVLACGAVSREGMGSRSAASVPGSGASRGTRAQRLRSRAPPERAAVLAGVPSGGHGPGRGMLA